MWKSPLQIFIANNEDWTSKMAGNINTNRTIFLINSRITGNRRNQTGPLRRGQSGQMIIITGVQ